MADVKRQMDTGDIPFTNPMNLTCKPVQTAAGAATKYAVVIAKDGNATMPNGYTATVFQSTEQYNIKSDDSSIDFNIPAGGLGIYSK
jgi:hypothetical protein